MEMLADLWVTCPVCNGRRYDYETLQVHFKGKSIADCLEMDIQESLVHFEAIPKIAGKTSIPSRCRARLPQAWTALADALGR